MIKRAWSTEDFDFNGSHFKLSGVRAKPGPIGGTRPIIINAGSSGAGQAFAMRNCDAFFTSTGRARLEAAGTSQAVDEQQIFNRIMIFALLSAKSAIIRKALSPNFDKTTRLTAPVVE